MKFMLSFLDGEPLREYATAIPLTRERLIVLGIILILAFALLLLVLLIRKKQRRHSRHHRHHPTVSGTEVATAEDKRIFPSRKRRRRRPHRPRNPTLSQTGGLPPLRADDPSAPPATHPET